MIDASFANVEKAPNPLFAKNLREAIAESSNSTGKL